jgi:MtfA peptidase
VLGFLKRRRRDRLRAQPVPERWGTILERTMPLYRSLPDDTRRELHGHMHVFLDEKQFEGCGGLDLTEEMEVTIAAQACLLLLNRVTDYYPRLYTILVYPTAYTAPIREERHSIVTEGEEDRSGEAWEDGVIVLAWEDVLEGAADPDDGFNLVLHEFAHQLDQEDSDSNGAPPLGRDMEPEEWARVMRAEFERLRRAAERGRHTLLDEYGATDPAEFFAVATETFFEQPFELAEEHPELFAQLERYYRQDPRRYFGEQP